MEAIIKLIRSGDYQKAYNQHMQHQNDNPDQAPQRLNKKLKRELGNKYLEYRDWLLYQKFSSNKSDLDEFFEDLLETNFMDRKELVVQLKNNNMPEYLIRNKAGGALFTLPDAKLPANKVLYASHTQIMNQGYVDIISYHSTHIAIWDGINAQDALKYEGLINTINHAAELLVLGENVTINGKQRDYIYLHWDKLNISATVIKVDESFTNYWGTST